MVYGYITYISNDRDIRGVLSLYFNLKKVKSKYNLFCVCTENVSGSAKQNIRQIGVIVKEFNLMEKLTSCNIDENFKDMIIDRHLFGKFFIFNISEIDSFVYLDTDILIEKNIDHLFAQSKNSNIFMVPDMQASEDYSKIILIKDRFNSGVIVSKTNDKIFRLLFSLLSQNVKKIFNDKSIFISDQYIFELLNSKTSYKINQLDICYNIHPILIESAVQLNIIKEPFIIHFMVNPKPWELMDLEISNHTFENKICMQYFIKWINNYNELIQHIYFKNKPMSTNVKTYHWGKYNNDNNLEYSIDSIGKMA
tara:strand:+ start:1251 stop:2177 length:927 start_codon:yes stop_codon:yes gene_type:complete